MLYPRITQTLLRVLLGNEHTNIISGRNGERRVSVSRMKIKYEEIFQSFHMLHMAPAPKGLECITLSVCWYRGDRSKQALGTEHEGMRLQSQVEERVEQWEIVDQSRATTWLPIAIDK